MPNRQQPDDVALLKDLQAYENPEASTDLQNPHVYRLNIPGKPYDAKGAALKVDLDGAQLKSCLRALMTVTLKHLPKESLEQYLASTIYLQSEDEMYLFFLRHFPNLMTDFFITLSQIALVSPGSVGTITFSGDDRKDFERHQKDLLEVNLKRLRKKIKQMLRTRTRGGKTSSLAPDLRGSLHLTYDRFHETAKTIKKHYDSLSRTFHAQRNRASQKEWQPFWIEHAMNVFSDQPRAFLELFSDAAKPSASEIAYAWVSQTTGLRQSYIRKLVKELRKASRAREKETLKAND
jgi:hypothetical protein